MTSGGRRMVAVALGAASLCAWCGYVSGFHRATTPARVTWGVSLAVVVVIDTLLWRGRRHRRFGLRLEPAGPWPRRGRGGWQVFAGVSAWLALALVMAAWDVLGLDTSPHQAHLTISALTQALRSLNAAMLLVWMVAGVGYGAAKARAPLSLSPSAGRTQGTARAHGAALPAAGAWLASQVGAVVPARVVEAPALLLPANRSLGVGFWLGVVAVGVAIDQVARRSHGLLANAEELVRFVTGPRAANFVLVAAWVYAGYHLFAH